MSILTILTKTKHILYKQHDLAKLPPKFHFNISITPQKTQGVFHLVRSQIFPKN